MGLSCGSPGCKLQDYMMWSFYYTEPALLICKCHPVLQCLTEVIFNTLAKQVCWQGQCGVLCFLHFSFIQPVANKSHTRLDACTPVDLGPPTHAPRRSTSPRDRAPSSTSTASSSLGTSRRTLIFCVPREGGLGVGLFSAYTCWFWTSAQKRDSKKR